MTAKPKPLITDYQQLRHSLGLSQAEFWERLGVTQGTGSRYEQGQRVPKPLAILAWLVYIGSPRSLRGDSSKPGVSGRGTSSSPRSSQHQPQEKEMVPVPPIVDFRQLRHGLGLDQTEFWGRLGVKQSAGSLYERGIGIPKPVAILARLVYVDGQDIDARKFK